MFRLAIRARMARSLVGLVAYLTRDGRNPGSRAKSEIVQQDSPGLCQIGMNKVVWTY